MAEMIEANLFEEQISNQTGTQEIVEEPIESDIALAAIIPVDPKETELLELAQHGDSEALAVVWQIYKQRVFNTAMRILRDHDESEDVAQDVFVKFEKHIAKFKLGCSPLPWLNRITRNHCLNKVNRAKRHRMNLVGAISGDDAVNQDPEWSQYYEAEDMSTPSPFEILSKKEDIYHLREALSRLHADFREIIQLAFFEDMSYKQMAEYLSIPIGTVMSRLYNAKGRLREEFHHVVRTAKPMELEIA
jgi:RNA polymerase sigma-70 factor, ECF subfamily